MQSTVRRASWIRRPPALYLGALLVTLLVTWKLTASYTVLSHTVDEPTHISSGLEWIESGTQRLHPENPPLGRIGAGLGSYLSGYHLPESGTAPQRGTELLYRGDRYLHNLAAARLATLPFFLLTLLLVWHWANQLGGPRAGLISTLSVATLPPLLGHAGLATTDLPFVAMFLLLLWTFVGWMESPTLGRSAALGVALGLSLATKFSTLLFFPPSALAALLLWRLSARTAGDSGPPPDWARMLLGAVLLLPLSGLVVWSAYRFDVGRVDEIPGAERTIEVAFADPEGIGRTFVEGLAHRPIPAPGALHGLIFLKAHTVRGHSSYLLGHQSEHGFWYFYPVALAVKTPLSFVALTIAGLIGIGRQGIQRRWRAVLPVVAAATIVVVSMFSTINIGVRHVLVVYPLLAIAIGLGIDTLIDGLQSRRRRFVALGAGLVLAWQVALVVTTYPDYLAYFNPLAGSAPGRVLVDSDLDWGQDALRLREVVAGKNVPLLHIAYFGSVRLCDHRFPQLEWLQPGERVSGWVAISEMYYRNHWRVTYGDVCNRSTTASPSPEGLSYQWLHEHEPVAVVGSIRLYHIPGG